MERARKERSGPILSRRFLARLMGARSASTPPAIERIWPEVALPVRRRCPPILASALLVCLPRVVFSAIALIVQWCGVRGSQLWIRDAMHRISRAFSPATRACIRMSRAPADFTFPSLAQESVARRHLPSAPVSLAEGTFLLQQSRDLFPREA